MRRVKGEPMIWAYPRDRILYPRASYYYKNMFIIYIPFIGHHSDFIKIIQSRKIDVTSSCFPSLVPCLKFT